MPADSARRRHRIRSAFRIASQSLQRITSPPGLSSSPDHDHLKQGVIWNFASFAVIGLAGVLMNVLVANFYAPSVLGAFNQVLAIYIIAAQVAAFGVHYSVLYHTSVLAEDPRQAGEATRSGLLAAAAISGLVCSGLWLGRHVVTNSEAVEAGLEAAIPGLFLFPLNKILMAALNGGRRMRAFAGFNAGRYVLIVGAIVAGAFGGLPSDRVPLCLTIAEVALFLGLTAANLRLLRLPSVTGSTRDWIGKHLDFGSRGVAGGLLVEFNTRVDILVLGAVVNDTAVGIYSIGAIFAEGLSQLFLVLRTNLDPMLARLIAEHRWQELDALIAWGKTVGYVGMGIVGLLAIAVYPFVLGVLVGKPEFLDSWPVFTILTCGLMLSAGYVPFGGILQQGGHPLAQSTLSGTIAGLNLVGNLILARSFGPIGAAVATAAVQASSPLILYVLVRRQLRIRL